jgi:two-component system LytT family response regulator
MSELGATPAWRVAIADDEPMARLRLRTLLGRHEGFTVVAECASGRETLAMVATHRPDVLFLDIRMPDLDGVAVAEQLLREPAGGATPAVVFVTAHDEHAVRAFDLDAVDYLLKPVDIDRFDRTLARVAETLRARDAGATTPHGRDAASALRAAIAALDAVRRGDRFPTRLAVRDAKGVYFVPVADIDRVEADGNYVALWAKGRRHLLRESMRGLEERLDPDRFVRIHRSIMVAVDRIARLEPWGHGEYLVTLADGSRVTSSRTYGERLQALLR